MTAQTKVICGRAECVNHDKTTGTCKLPDITVGTDYKGAYPLCLDYERKRPQLCGPKEKPKQEAAV